jgi:predicted O-methyltransferase YrrM
MKDRLGAILRPAQERYIERLQPPRDPLLAEMEAYAAEHDVPVSDPEVGRLLEILAAAVARGGPGSRPSGGAPGAAPPRILEVGTAIGYGALLLARAAPEARVVTIDRDPEMLARARGYLERAGVAERVELVEGEALAALERVEGPFVLAYVDAEKVQYRRYLDHIVPKLAVGGVVAFDNVLWKGWVAEPPEDEADENADALRAFNGYLMIHPQLRAQVLPIGDGFGIATKVKPTILEMGGPF